MDMFVEVLRNKYEVKMCSNYKSLFKSIFSGSLLHPKSEMIIYTSLIFPLVLIFKILRPSKKIYYMIRGDEIEYVKQKKRHFRAKISFLFQYTLNKLGCHFVFVCEDLKYLFENRYGNIKKAHVLPNTLGKKLPDSKCVDRNIALVGDFDTVKNIEWAIENLSNGKFDVHLYGNHQLPGKWQRPWLHAHGLVQDLTSCLHDSCSLVIFPDTSAGFPNVLIEAMQVGCGAIVHREFPFKYLPVSEQWRFDLNSNNHRDSNSKDKCESDLEAVLSRLLEERRNFKRDNKELIALVESDWEKRVWEIFG